MNPFRLALTSVLTAASILRLASAEPAPTSGVSHGVGVVEAYQDLLKENLDLRKRATAQAEAQQAAEAERDRLQGTVRDLEKRLVETATALQTARDAQKAAAAEPAALQARINAAEGERDRLRAELADAQSKLAAATATAPASAPAVGAGSDMFRKVEAERAALQQRVKSIEAERDAASRSVEALQAELAAVKEESALQRAALQDRDAQRETLLKVVPFVRRLQNRQHELERELAARESERDAARAKVDELEGRLASLAKLSRRWVEADMAADVAVPSYSASTGEIGAELAAAGGGPQTQAGLPSDPFGMLCHAAGLLVDQSKPKAAIRAYERALKLRPDAADVHYNLGILYEQEVGDARTAIRHYEEYLRLQPHAADSDQVRAWLMEARVRI